MTGGTVKVGSASCRCRTSTRCCTPTTAPPRREAIDYYARIAPVMVPAPRRPVHHVRSGSPTACRRPGSSRSDAQSTGPTWVPTRTGPGRPRRRHRLLPVRRAGGAGVGGEHGGARAARADGCCRRPRHATGDGVRLRPRRAGDDQGVLRDRAVGSRGARRGRPGRVVQDVGIEGPADVRARSTRPCTHEGAADFALAVGQVLEQQHAATG